MDDTVCKICNKIYASYKSLWNHNKKFHKDDVKENVKVCKGNVKENVKVCKGFVKVNTNCEYSCNYCNKIFKSRQYKWEHQTKFCKIKKHTSIDNNIITEIKKENIEIKDKLNQLLKLCKIHPKTLQKINNQLTNNITNNTNNTNNGTINNTVNIVKFGSEDIASILSQSEILKILNRKMLALEESIKTIHFNDMRPEFKNIYITNLKDQYAYIYNGNKFIAVLKSDVLGELVDNHFENIEYSADEYKEKLNSKTVEVLDKFIDKMNNEDETFVDNEHAKSYPNFKSYNINKIKMMIYNESDKNIVNIICDKTELPNKITI